MKRFTLLVVVALMVLAAPLAGAEQALRVDGAGGSGTYTFMGKEYQSEAAFRADFARNGGRCAVTNPSQAVLETVELMLSEAPGAVFGESRVTAAATTGFNVPVAFHVIHDGTNGLLTQTDLDNQIQVLNAAFAPLNVSFTIASVDFTDNANWFYMEPGTTAEAQAKAALNVSPQTTLNFYTVQTNYLGWATFPWNLAGNPDDDGIVVLWASLPGGPAVPYDEGDTATHEIGHWLGLYHTFQGGCSKNNDYVDDTAPERDPAFGCPIGRDTCKRNGPDPIHNYMDYSDDFCMYEFTAGQISRMYSAKDTYRPLL